MAFTNKGIRASLLCLALFCLAGCNESPTQQRGASDAKRGSEQQEIMASEVLEQMVQAYADRSEYADEGVFQLRYRQDGRGRIDEAPFAVRFRRPNQLSMHAYQVTLVCDGERLHARLEDQPTGDLDGQVLVQPAAPAWSLDLLLRDRVLQQAVVEGLGRHPLPLELLLEKHPLAAVRQASQEPSLLEPQSVDGQACFRVSAQTAAGKFVFWVDQVTKILRRLEYPPELFLRQIGDPGVDDVRVVAEFKQATFEPPSDERAFRFDMPNGANQVAQLLVPPRPLATELFGKRPEPFFFTASDGGQLSGDALQGRIVVLLWFNDHPLCRAALQQLDAVRTRYRSDARFHFAAVSTDPSAVTNDRVAAQLQNWRVSLPWVRDLEACGRDVFQIPGAPTLVVLDGQGRLQVFQVGLNPALADELPQLLGRLAEGEDLASLVLARHQEEQKRYADHLAGKLDVEQLTSYEHRSIEARPFSSTKSLRLTKRWETEELERPGNVLAELLPEGVRWLVLDDGQAVVELDVNGRRGRSWQLPSDVGQLSFVRSGQDAGGKWFAGLALRGRHAYLFDSSWRLVAQLPRERQDAEVRDVQLADLDGDGVLEAILGMTGAANLPVIECFARDGRRKWGASHAAAVLSVAVDRWTAAPDRQLLATGPDGRAYAIAGTPGLVEAVSMEREVFHIFAAGSPGPTRAKFCGLTFAEDGNLLALGLDDALGEMWSLPLAAGTFQAPIQFVISTQIGAVGYWILAAPDGTVHFVSDDGQHTDAFATGRLLAGIAAAVRGEAETELVLTTGSQVTCWSLQPPAER